MEIDYSKCTMILAVSLVLSKDLGLGLFSLQIKKIKKETNNRSTTGICRETISGVAAESTVKEKLQGWHTAR